MGFAGYFSGNVFLFGVFHLSLPEPEDPFGGLVLDELRIFLGFGGGKAGSKVVADINEKAPVLVPFDAAIEEICFRKFLVGLVEVRGISVFFREVFVEPEEDFV